MAMIKIFLPFILTAVLAILTIYLAKNGLCRKKPAVGLIKTVYLPEC